MKRSTLVYSLAALLTVTLLSASCGDNATVGKDTSTPVTEDPNASLRGERLPSSLPESLDLGEETIRIWYYTQGGSPAESAVDLAGSLDGDIVDDATYKRNQAIEEDLNVRFKFHDAGIHSGQTGEMIRTIAMANEDVYDIYTICQWNAASLAAEHFFLDLIDAPYLDLDQPWWSTQYIDACAIGRDNLYFLTGDVSLDMIRCISALYFNKNMLQSLDFSDDELYQSVMDGTWTIEKMLNYAEAAYVDVNFNGRTDDGDVFGFTTNGLSGIDSMSFALGLQLTDRDEDHYPILVGDKKHNISVAETMQKIYKETPGVISTSSENGIDYFYESEALFLAGFIYTAEHLRNMGDDFGIIPYPKYDENQKDYISVLHDITSLMCVPTTCTKIDSVAATLEAMAYYSYYDVTPVYYEDTLKIKFSRDETTPKIIDIIRDSAYTDTAYVYIGAFGNLGHFMRLDNAFKKYTSTYQRYKKSAEKSMEAFISAFEEDF